MKNRVYYFVSLSLLMLFVGGLQASTSSKPPVDIFFKNPEFREFQVSPDAKSIAVLAPYNGTMNLYVFDLDKREPKLLTGEKLDVTGFSWVNNERLIYSMAQNTFGVEEQKYRGGIISINKDGTDHQVLVQPYVSKNSTQKISYLSRYKKDKDWILVSNNQRRRDYPDIFLMNVYTGALKRVFNNPGRINSFFFDECDRARFGISMNEDGSFTTYYRPAEKDEWILQNENAEDYSIIVPVAISCDSNEGIIAARGGRDTNALFKYNFLTGERSEKPILASSTYDINGAITSFGGEGLVGFFYQAEKPKQIYFEKNHKAIQEMVDKALPDTFNRVTSYDDDGNILVIFATSDKKAPAYHLLYLDTMKLEPLGKTMPWLDEYELSERKPISYEARDGLTIHGYLTLPKDYEKGKPVPLIINPHGGPWARDTWDLQAWFHFEPQFYASRGFAVLQVNFRGSTGYGLKHLKSSFKNLEDMHHDVVDGVRWAIDAGYADKNKIGIAGASWGGYATMTALTKNPELFRFGINLFGVVDLVEHINTYKEWDRDEGYGYWLKRIGDPKDEADYKNLVEWSAMTHLDRIDDPVFIYHGVRDFNVDVEQSRKLESELKSLGKDSTFILRTDEAHSASDEGNRIDTYKQIDAFLDRVTKNW